MSKPSYASVTFDVDARAQRRPVETASDTPFRILLLGDFSGRANRGEPPPDQLKPYLIDRDNLDQIMARMRPELQLGAHGRGLVMRFRELEDFHPDRIYRQDAFEKFRTARQVLATQAPAAPAPSPAPPPPDVRTFTGGSLLDSVLETTEAEPPRQPDALQEFVERAVAPHTAPREDPRLAAETAEVVAQAGQVMRALLHHAGFQALEAAWRSVDWLVRGLETGPQLKIFVLDLSRADLAGKLRELRTLLVDEAGGTLGGEPWAVVAGNFTFARTESDIRMLAALAASAGGCNCSTRASSPGEARISPLSWKPWITS